MCQAVLEELNTHTEFHEQHRSAIAKAYEERLERRRARVVQLRHVFPDFYHRFESHLCNRAGLNAAMESAHRQHRHGEVGAKAFNNIRRRVQAALADLPPLAEPLPTMGPRELLERVPLFAGLSVESLEQLARHARLLTFLPGDIVLGEHEMSDALYVIVRGEVAVQERGQDAGETQSRKLYDGGKTTVFSDGAGRAAVTATSTARLLRFSRPDVLALADKDPEVRRRLDESMEAPEARQS